MVRIPEGSAPDFKNKSYRITAEVEIPESGAEGVLMTQGGRFNGLGLYLLQGKPVFHYNLVGVDQTSIAAKDALDPGKVDLGEAQLNPRSERTRSTRRLKRSC